MSIHLDEPSSSTNIGVVRQQDPVTAAFAKWKAAQDEFLEAEQRYFEAENARSKRLFSFNTRKKDALLLDVQVKRARAEGMLLTAMKLLGERQSAARSPHTRQ